MNIRELVYLKAGFRPWVDYPFLRAQIQGVSEHPPGRFRVNLTTENDGVAWVATFGIGPSEEFSLRRAKRGLWLRLRAFFSRLFESGGVWNSRLSL